MHVLQFLKST